MANWHTFCLTSGQPATEAGPTQKQLALNRIEERAMEATVSKTNRRTEGRLPDPETIRRRAERIRMHWSQEERRQRAEQARRYLVQLASQL
jgi:hypothetical protein